MSQTDHAFDRDGNQLAIGSRVLLVQAPALAWVVGRIGRTLPSGATQLWLVRPGMDVTRTAAAADVLHEPMAVRASEWVLSCPRGDDPVA